MSFKVDVDDLLDLSLFKVKHKIQATYKCPLRDLKLFDVLLDEDKNVEMRHGVYMFFNENDACMYVGKCSSSHFAHRLGGHFGMSPNYGMNTFLRRMVNVTQPTPHTYQSYINTLKAIGGYKYLMIGANGKGPEFIGRLEKLIQTIYQPFLNSLPKNMAKMNSNLVMENIFSSYLPAAKRVTT